MTHAGKAVPAARQGKMNPKRSEDFAVMAFVTLCGFVLSGFIVGLMYVGIPAPRGLGRPDVAMSVVLLVMIVAYVLKESLSDSSN